jgi:hypothetical protein
VKTVPDTVWQLNDNIEGVLNLLNREMSRVGSA